MIVAVVHPNNLVRDWIGVMVQSCFRQSPNPIKEIGHDILHFASLTEIPSETSLDLIIAYFHRVDPQSEDIEGLRRLRMGGQCAPLLAMSFALSGAHNALIHRSHRLLTLPFLKQDLQNLFVAGTLTPFTCKREAENYVREFFCDKCLLKTLLRRIEHHATNELNPNWAGVNEALCQLDLCLDDARLQPLRNLLAEKSPKSPWTHAIQKLLEEVDR